MLEEGLVEVVRADYYPQQKKVLKTNNYFDEEVEVVELFLK